MATWLCLTAVVACSCLILSHGFAPPLPSTSTRPSSIRIPTSLNVWWFGGTETTEVSGGSQDSCELVAVRIERPTPNSRKIAGEITVDAPLRDVWAILTDYNQLAVHVPNLVESKTVGLSKTPNNEQGDGSYQCRLFQRGAQKIIGFEFGASVTMDMTEQILGDNSRKIGFKCVESPFFSEFDGEWCVTEKLNASGETETVVSYQVLVKPRGPVPVAALEWRIREDVPTNLRAVKQAALTVGYEGVEAKRHALVKRIPLKNGVSRRLATVASAARRTTAQQQRQPRLATYPASDWGDDETMAAYLKE